MVAADFQHPTQAGNEAATPLSTPLSFPPKAWLTKALPPRHQARLPPRSQPPASADAQQARVSRLGRRRGCARLLRQDAACCCQGNSPPLSNLPGDSLKTRMRVSFSHGCFQIGGPQTDKVEGRKRFIAPVRAGLRFSGAAGWVAWPRPHARAKYWPRASEPPRRPPAWPARRKSRRREAAGRAAWLPRNPRPAQMTRRQ